MGIFQILLLQCLIQTIFAGISAEITQECYCVPITDSEKRVSETLKLELQQDERLVVYLYKNSHNEVTIYIPNSEKQKELPEFTLDDDDVLKKNVTVNTNDLFTLDNLDVTIHENNSGLDVNSNQLLDISNSLTISNLPYLITGYMPFLQIPLNLQNIPNCCDITLPGPIHHHLNDQKESTCCANANILLQNLFGISTDLLTNNKEIAKNGLESNENKIPPNVDTTHPQDVKDHIPESTKENKPSSPDGIDPVLDSIIHQSNTEKPLNSDVVHPQGIINLIIPPSSEEKPLNSDNVHAQDVLDVIIPPSDEVNPSNSSNFHLQDILDLIIPPLDIEKPSKSDNTHQQHELDLIIPESNEVEPSTDVLDYIIKPEESNEENIPLNPDGIQNEWEFIIPQSNEAKPLNSDMEDPQDVLDYIIPAPNEKNIPSNTENVVHKWNSIIPQLNEEYLSKLDNVYPQDVLHHIFLEMNKNKKPADLHNVYPQNVLDPKKTLKPDNNYQVHVQDLSDIYKIYENSIPQDLTNQKKYEMLIARDLKDKQQYTKPDHTQNPYLIFHGPKHSKDSGKYNDDILMLLNKYLSSLKEKDSYLFNQNKTSGSSQINDHYNIISELNRPQINNRPSQAFGHITFDQWLTLQVKVFKKYEYAMSYTIDIKMLKLLLQKTLYRNGISMTNAGDLIDFSGERFSIDRLELRPVLIGDPLKYEEFLSSHNCVIPSKLPYIEAILVRLSKPRRFLGLISLSDASFFDSRRSGSLICPPNSNEIGFSSVPIKSESLLEYSNNPWNTHNSLNNMPDYQDQLWESKNTNVKPINKGFSDLEDISPPKELSSEDMDYGDIGIRIIGGQAATSSGTPVSSRGRRSINDLNENR